MDDRVIKRLLAIFVLSLIVLALFKAGLTNTYTSVSKATAENKQAATKKPAAPKETPSLSVGSDAIEIPAAADEEVTPEHHAAPGANGAQ